MGTGMIRYREGQKVRIDYTAGGAIEGTVQRQSGLYFLVVNGETASTLGMAESTDGRTITVLSEPRPDEPTGLGAVVQDGRWKYVRVYSREVLAPYVWRVEDPEAAMGKSFYRWGDLNSPMVLSEGWTP